MIFDKFEKKENFSLVTHKILGVTSNKSYNIIQVQF